MPAKRRRSSREAQQSPVPRKTRSRTKRDADTAVEQDTQFVAIEDYAGAESIVSTFEIRYEDKVMSCESRRSGSSSLIQGSNELRQLLIFTHGAGGTLATPAVSEFAEGFSSRAAVVCFQGTGGMSLPSRVKNFHAAVEYVQSPEFESGNPHSSGSGTDLQPGKEWSLGLGGRSLGARAAVMTYLDLVSGPQKTSEQVKGLILVSYPLVSPKGEVRDQILKDIKNVDVLFIIGDGDSMCPLPKLNTVRKRMKVDSGTRSWLVVVTGADHGMKLKKDKECGEAMRRETGKVAAEWLKDERRNDERSNCLVEWDQARRAVVKGEWTASAQSLPI